MQLDTKRFPTCHNLVNQIIPFRCVIHTCKNIYFVRLRKIRTAGYKRQETNRSGTKGKRVETISTTVLRMMLILEI